MFVLKPVPWGNGISHSNGGAGFEVEATGLPSDSPGSSVMVVQQTISS